MKLVVRLSAMLVMLSLLGALQGAQFVPATKNSTGINAAIQSLVSSADGGELYLPAGEYLINTPIKFPAGQSRAIKIRGEGQNVTRLKVTGSAGLDLISTDWTHTMTLHDFTVFTETNGVATGIKITYPNPQGDSLAMRHRNAWATLERINIRSGTSTGYFARGVDLWYAWNTKLRDCQISGRGQAGGNQGVGLLFSKASINSVIENCQLSFWNRGIEFVPPGAGEQRHEGCQISTTSIIAVNTGIYYNPSSSADAMALYWLSVQNCHLDVRTPSPGSAVFGVFLGNTRESIFKGNLIYAGGDTGFKVCMWVWGDMITISGNQFRAYAYGPGDSGNGVVVGDATGYGSSAVTVSDNVFWEISNGTGVWLQSGTTECRVIGNTFKDGTNLTRVANSGNSSNQLAFN